MKKLILTVIITCCFLTAFSQEKKYLSLQNVIEIAAEQSLDAFRSENMYLASYWEFRYFKADRLPSLSLQQQATLV